jgi:hypothetical protein
VERFKKFVRSTSGKIEEILEITDEGLSHETKGYCRMQLNWSSLASFKATKKSIEVFIGGITLEIPKDILSEKEVSELLALLEKKKTESGSGEH